MNTQDIEWWKIPDLELQQLIANPPDEETFRAAKKEQGRRRIAAPEFRSYQ